MSTRTWIAAAGALSGVALVAYALLSATTDEERIGAQLDRLEQTLHLTGETTNPLLLKAHFAESFEEVFSEDVTYRIPELSTGTRGRNGLSSLAARSALYYRTLDVNLADRRVEITASGLAATVTATAVLRAVRDGSPERDERRVRFELTNGSDGWQIASVRVSEGERLSESPETEE